MNAPIGWWWPAVAIIATGVAFAAGPVYALAVPAATVAVVAAALTILEVILRQRGEVGGREYRISRAVGVRGAFVGGVAGREDVVLTLDLLERRITRPDLPARTPREIAEIARLSPAEFRRYVAKRLDDLEGPQ